MIRKSVLRHTMSLRHKKVKISRWWINVSHAI